MFRTIILILFLSVNLLANDYIATAYAIRGKTATGNRTRKGIIAADPKRLPLGTRVRITNAGAYNGVYIVADTGGGVKGNRIDIWMPSTREAIKFGRRKVRIEILK